ncbi:MAG: CoA-binding protein, partial [Magnetococcales bacterium]|nr:CoA-binding protein [Magnetococcales bacterium]
MSEPTDNALVTLLSKARVIAVVGLSPKPDRASFRVASYM